MNSASEIRDRLLELVEACGLRRRLAGSEGSMLVGIQGETALFDVFIDADDRLLASVVVIIPMVVPEPKRLAMAEAVTRANDSLRLGNFDLDLGEGTMSFRSALPVADGALSQKQFEILMNYACSAADLYYPAFCRLVYGDDLSPAEAIAEVEMDP